MFGLFRKSERHRRESAFGLAMLGCMLGLASFPTLFLNEGRAVKTARALNEGASAVVSADPQQVDGANEGKFVHIAGEASTDEMLTDETFGVTVNAIRLTRSAEMFQWKEIEEKVTRKSADGESTTEKEYSYKKTWSAVHLSSEKYHDASIHQNPASFPFSELTVEAKNVDVGTYRLSPDLIAKMNDPQPLAVDLSSVPVSLAANLRPDGGTESSANGFYWSRVAAPPVQQVTEKSADTPGSNQAEIVLPKPEPEPEPEPEPKPEPEPEPKPEPSGQPIGEPQIGDLRIHFTATYPADVSVMAEQTGNTFKPFKTRNGRELNMLSAGIMSAEEMIERAETENTMFTWAMRVAGSLMLVIGIGLILKPISSMTERIPILGNIVGMGTTLVALLLGFSLALFTVAVAWLFYRPLISIPLIAISGGILVWLFRRSKQTDNDVLQALPVPDE